MTSFQVKPPLSWKDFFKFLLEIYFFCFDRDGNWKLEREKQANKIYEIKYLTFPPFRFLSSKGIKRILLKNGDARTNNFYFIFLCFFCELSTVQWFSVESGWKSSHSICDFKLIRKKSIPPWKEVGRLCQVLFYRSLHRKCQYFDCKLMRDLWRWEWRRKR